jgi:hypothetical protein
MSVAQGQMSKDELLQAVKQLAPPEFEQFISQVIALEAQRKAPSLPKAESELLIKINQGVPAAMQKRFDELVATRRAETLTHDERDELLQLTREIENLQARRVGYLAELARLRGISLTELMQTLGIKPPAYA